MYNSSAWRQKDLTGYCFKYIDRPFCLRTDELYVLIMFIDIQTSKELIQMDINKLMTYDIFTMDGYKGFTIVLSCI